MTKNFEKVFSTFKRHYQLVPLEVFGRNPYKTLISTMLSSRTKDETTLAASQRLFTKAPDIPGLSKLKIETLESLIHPVGFYKTKTRNLHRLARMLLGDFGGKVPQTREELMRLPGVGRKTANLVLNRAFKIPAIAVDTHVHKISNMLGWVNTKTPEKTELALLKVLPKKYWPDTNRLMVSIGRQYTTAIRLRDFLKKEQLI